MKKEEIEKYCKKYTGLVKHVAWESAFFDVGKIEANELFKKVEKFKKKHKLKSATLEIDREDDSIELRGERKRTQKEITTLIKELKEQEKARNKTEEKYKKEAVEQELKEYRRLKRKFNKK